MKILNLYASLGGNRYKWNTVQENIQVTAVELDPDLCDLYQKRFENDNVICGDAHSYLLENYHLFDFIWSSPPCPTHSKARFASALGNRTKPKFPDLTLYQEIIFLQNYFKGFYVVENVIPYYKPLIPAQKIGRHLIWSNFNVKGLKHRTGPEIGKAKNEVKKWCAFHDFDFYTYSGTQPKNKIARNLVDYELGKNIFSKALNVYKENKTEQCSLF